MDTLRRHWIRYFLCDAPRWRASPRRLFMASSERSRPEMAVRAAQVVFNAPKWWERFPDVTGRLVGLVDVGVVGAGVGQVLGGTGG